MALCIIIGYPARSRQNPFPVFVGEKNSDALAAMKGSTADHFEIFESAHGRRKNNPAKQTPPEQAPPDEAAPDQAAPPAQAPEAPEEAEASADAEETETTTVSPTRSRRRN